MLVVVVVTTNKKKMGRRQQIRVDDPQQLCSHHSDMMRSRRSRVPWVRECEETHSKCSNTLNVSPPSSCSDRRYKAFVMRRVIHHCISSLRSCVVMLRSCEY